MSLTHAVHAGEECPFSHGVHEQLLHPAKFRTTLCKRAGTCNRECCFFAHSAPDLRAPEYEPSNHTRLRASQLMVRCAVKPAA